MTKAYACYNKEINVRLNSSSGGIYPLLATSIINHGGIVFAACYDAELNVIHRKIDSLEKIMDSQGSKYVASKICDIFGQVKSYLQEAKEVLFVGTPCQCEGLLSYLCNSEVRSEMIHEKLYCIDFVCHGVTGQKTWDKYREGLKKIGYTLTKVNMRDKSSGWSKYTYSWKLDFDDGSNIVQPQQENIYIKGFVNNLYLRQSCYECQFKGIERRTDFTLADYWNVWNIQPEMDDNNGTSLVLIHTEKGQQLFETLKDHLVYTNALLEKAVLANPSIIKTPVFTGKRQLFFQKLSQGQDFEKIVDELTKISVGRKIINMIVRITKHLFGEGGKSLISNPIVCLEAA